MNKALRSFKLTRLFIPAYCSDSRLLWPTQHEKLIYVKVASVNGVCSFSFHCRVNKEQSLNYLRNGASQRDRMVCEKGRDKRHATEIW